MLLISPNFLAVGFQSGTALLYSPNATGYFSVARTPNLWHRWNMRQPYEPKRLVTLANGARVPFESACDQLGMLHSYLGDDSLEWDMLFLLRQVCLNRPLEPEQTQALVREKLLLPDAAVDPILRDVVLAAVRGEGPLLRLDSPFTDPLDRAMAEFVQAREYIRTSMERVRAHAFFTHDPTQQSCEKLRDATDAGPSWTQREDDRTPPSGEPPPR